MNIGRWELGDLAKDRHGRKWEVIGIVTDPAIVLRDNEGHVETKVVGSLVEKELIQYKREERSE